MPELTPEQAHEFMAGPLGLEMQKFPVRFCKPLFFGEPPLRGNLINVNSGTATLLDLGAGRIAVTCAHVIAAYRARLRDAPNCQFNIGNCQFDPVPQIIGEDVVADLTTIRLTDQQANAIVRNSNGIGEAFYATEGVAPRAVAINDFVAYGGFPGQYRRAEAFDLLNFGTYSSGACRVMDIHNDHIVCGFEREHWVRHFGEPEPEVLGGLSGGPAFALRRTEAGVMHYEFAGVIYMMHEDEELLFIRNASAVPLRF